MSPEIRTAAAAATAVCVGAAVAYFSVLYGNHVDLDTFAAATAAFLARESPYTPGDVPFVYPPAGLLVALLSVGGSWLWAAVSVVALARSIWVLTRVAWPALGVGALVERAGWIFTLVVLLQPTLLCLAYGQVGLLLLWAAIEGVLAKPESPRGMLLGLAVAVKLTPAYLVLVLALGRAWGTVWWAVAGAAVSTAVAVAVDPEALSAYLGGGYRLAVEANLRPDTQDHSIAGYVKALGLPVSVWFVSAVLVGVVGAVIGARLVRRRDLLSGVAVALVASLLVSPISWTHHWVAAFPALVVLCRDKHARPLRYGLMLAGCLAWLMMADRMGPLTDHLSEVVVDVPWWWTTWQEWSVFWGLAYLGYAVIAERATRAPVPAQEGPESAEVAV